MRKILLFLLFLIIVLPSSVNAHVRGQPIMQINGKDTQVHPVQKEQSFVFDLPPDTDIGSESYLINESISFVLDQTRLPIQESIWKKTDLIWDFGDGSVEEVTFQGLNEEHIYQKSGTFILKVYAHYQSEPIEKKQLIQSTVLHILPNRNYQIPTPVIRVNGEMLPNDKKVSLDLSKKVTLDASSSYSSGKITAYYWNLDDGNEKDGGVVNHKYRLPQYYATPILRITDENGFFVDSYVSITNNGSNQPSSFDFDNYILYVPIGLLIFSIIFTIFFFIAKKKS